MIRKTRFPFILIKLALLLIFSFSLKEKGCAQNKQDGECRVYLNFPYYSFEIYNGFPQLYKIGLRYSLFSENCNSFMAFIFSKPALSNYLIPDDKSSCNVYYEAFFNRCRCDSSSKLFIYKNPGKKVQVEKGDPFDLKLFNTSLSEIRDSALNSLKKAYPSYSVKIEYSSGARSANVQKTYFKSGSSKTLLSAHLLGVAADFSIYFNGVLVDPKPEGKGLYKSFEPYQILGKYILEKGYFWGLVWDPGHMQLRRKMQDILLEFPDLQNNGNMIASYCDIIKKEDSIPLKYKEVIEILDAKFGLREKRAYDLTKPWTEDSLLLPVTVDSSFHPAYLY